MAYIAPVHGASSIRHAIKLRLLSPDEDCLVVAKSNRLEIYSLTAEGLSLKHSVVIHGKPTILEKLVFPPSLAAKLNGKNERPCDHLFVATDRQVYFTVSWDTSTRQLKTEKKYIDISDPSSRLAQIGDRAQIDPTRRFMTMELYEGVITVIPIITDKDASKKRKYGSSNALGSTSSGAPAQLRPGDLGEPSQCRIEELFVRASTFLHTEDARAPPRLALLYEDTQNKVRVKLRELKIVEGIAELQPLDNVFRGEVDAGSSHVIPVPMPVGGMLVLGETTIRYMNDRTGEVVQRPLEEPTVFTAWEQIDTQRWILADDYCRLFFLMLVTDERTGTVRDWKIDCIGTASHAAVLVHLGAGIVFIGSHQGDSQVIRITVASFEVIQSFSNIAPILDFAVMDLGSRGEEHALHDFSSGQARIVTGSGAFQDGSLRSVRSGVGIEELGVLGEMEHTTDLWGLRGTLRCPEEYMDTLLVSFVNETRVFVFSPEAEVEEREAFLGLELGETTLLAQNLSGDRILQVTEKKAQICNLQAGAVSWSWTPPGGKAITSASANDQYLVVVVGGQSLGAFNIVGSRISVAGEFAFGDQNQVSDVTLSSEFSDACVFCHPTTAEVGVLDLKTMQILQKHSLGKPNEDIPRSVLLAQVLSQRPPSLFVSMADGAVLTFRIEVNYETATIRPAERITLSSEPATLKKSPRGNGLYNAFATCEQPSMIYGSDDSVIFSAADAEAGTRLCYFNTEAYPGAVAVATPHNLKIAMVDPERTTQVHSLPIGETAYRLAYSPSERAFGIGTIKRELIDGTELVSSKFMLADEVLFRKLSAFELNPDELVSSVVRIALPNGTDTFGKEVYKDAFAVGTGYADVAGDGEARGRVMLFEVTDTRELELICERPTRGACRALATLGEKRIVAALVKSVIVLTIDIDRFGQVSLTSKASYRTSTAPVDLAVTGNIIAVADLMKSVALLEHSKQENSIKESLAEVGRHYQTVWSTALAQVDENVWVEGDAEGNLIVLSRNVNGVTEDDKRRLAVTGEVQLGEMVNRIRPINATVIRDSVVVPKALMATVDGSIYLFGLIDPCCIDFLIRLQAIMANVVTTPGEISFNHFRAFKSKVRQSDEPYRFVDGELLERFLSLPIEKQRGIVDQVNAAAELARTEKMAFEGVRQMLEGLRRMH